MRGFGVLLSKIYIKVDESFKSEKTFFYHPVSPSKIAFWGLFAILYRNRIWLGQ